MTPEEANAVVTEAFNNYSAGILRYCEQKLKDVSNNADDCVQEAYNALFKKLLSGETVENIGGFLYSAARNHVLLNFRAYQQNIKKTVPLESVKNLITYEQDFLEYSTEELVELSSEIFPVRLNKNELKLLTLLVYTVDGKHLTDKQMAEQLHCSPGAVSQRKLMLRKKVENLLKEIKQNR